MSLPTSRVQLAEPGRCGGGAARSGPQRGHASRKPPLLEWAEIAAVQPILTLARVLPFRAGVGLAGAVGRLAYLNSSWRRLALDNLDIAFAGALTRREAEAVCRSAFVSFFTTIGELVSLAGRPAELLARTECDGWENLEAAARQGRGVIACSAHLANWYWPAMYGAARGVSAQVVVEPLANRLLDVRMNRILERYGLTPIPRIGRALRSPVEALRRGQVVGLMIDHDGAAGCRVPFFGAPAYTARGVAFYRRLSGCAVICVHDVRLRGRHRVVVSPPMTLPDDELEALTRINRHFEDVVRRHPESYFWMQPRWRARHEGGRAASA